MICAPILNEPYRLDRSKTPEEKLMKLVHHNFKTPGCHLARFGHGGFFSLDWNRWDGLPLDSVVMLRTVYVMPTERGNGCQRAILKTVELLAHKTGCAVLAVAHTFETKHTIETEEDFVDAYCCDWREPFRYFGPESEENRRQNAAFRRPAYNGSPIGQNLDGHENIGTWWITPEFCWIHIPETASPELIQKLSPRLVNHVPSLA